MASVEVTYLKKTHQEVVVKVGASGATGADILIGATSFCVVPGQLVVAGGASAAVSLANVTWTGDNATTIGILRQSGAAWKTVLTLPCTGSSTIDFTGQQLPLDNSYENGDIRVTFDAGAGQVYLKLRKTAGYVNTIETATLGVYDDPSKVG